MLLISEQGRATNTMNQAENCLSGIHIADAAVRGLAKQHTIHVSLTDFKALG